MPETADPARVTMLWPAELKDKVKEKVGQRNLTKFVVEAVEKHYQYTFGMPEKKAEVEATTPLPGDPVTAEDLVVTGPPDPSGGPVVADSADTGPSGATTPSTASAPSAPEDTFDPHAPMFTQGKTGTVEQRGEAVNEQTGEVTPPGKVLPTVPPTPGSKNDLFQKLQREGKELGIDLKPASEVLQPIPKDEPVGSPAARAPEGMTTCEFHPEMVVQPGHECYKCTLENNGTDTTPKPPAPVMAAAPAEPQGDVCAACGSLLADGECWECF